MPGNTLTCSLLLFSDHWCMNIRIISCLRACIPSGCVGTCLVPLPPTPGPTTSHEQTLRESTTPTPKTSMLVVEMHTMGIAGVCVALGTHTGRAGQRAPPCTKALNMKSPVTTEQTMNKGLDNLLISRKRPARRVGGDRVYALAVYTTSSCMWYEWKGVIFVECVI